MSKRVVVVFALVALAVLVGLAFAQSPSTTGEKVLVDRSLLTPEQIRDMEIKENMAKYGNWVGLGKEVGVAINEGLVAITDTAERFSNTKPGKWTIFLIAYKVIGKDLIQLVVGLFMLLVGLGLFVWIFPRNCLVKRIPVEAANGKPTKWTVYTPSTSTQWAYGGMFIAYVLVCLLVIFA